MTKSRITNREELRAEIRRLKAVSKEKETELLGELSALGENLRPENIVVNTLSKLTGIKIDKNEFLKNGILIGLGLLAQRFILKKEIQFERIIYGWVDNVFDKIRHYASKFNSVRSERVEQED